MIKSETMKFSQFLESKFIEWQQQQGGRKTVAEFAKHIGVKQSSISMWWTGANIPNGESVRLLAEKLGAEARTHIIAIETAIEKLHHQQTRQTLQTEQRNALHTFAQQDLTRLTHWILHDHPATVNHLLTTLCQTVTATPDLQFQFHWR